LKIISLLKIAVNYLQNKYNIFRHFLKKPRCTTVWNTTVGKCCNCFINSRWQSCAELLWL